MDCRLEKGLERLSALMADEPEPWWIIGSAALILSGIAGIVPDDIDVVGDRAMLRRVLAKARVKESEPKTHLQFRSSPYTRIKVDGGTDIEVQGDLELRENGAWVRLVFASRVAVTIGSARVFVPGIEEQRQIFRRFGRAKDLAKAAIVDRHIKPSAV